MSRLKKDYEIISVKSGNFGHQINSDIHLQTVEIQMRRLHMGRLISFSLFVQLIYFYIPIIKIWNEQSRCPNVADRPNLPGFTLSNSLNLLSWQHLPFIPAGQLQYPEYDPSDMNDPSLKHCVLHARVCHPRSAVAQTSNPSHSGVSKFQIPLERS